MISSATPMNPRNRPSCAISRGVIPWSASPAMLSCTMGSTAIPFSSRYCRFPTKYRVPAFAPARPAPFPFSAISLVADTGSAPSGTKRLGAMSSASTPSTPLPNTALNSFTSGSGRFLETACSTTASARGCSLFFSSAAAICSMVSSAISRTHTPVCITFSFPAVMVPVLSMTTVSTSRACCRASPDLIRMPWPAPTPVPTMIATGVASPRAQGQDITSTAMAVEMANSAPAPARSQTANVTRAMPMTTGTNTPATLSASWAIGALLALASSTRRMIWDRVVSSPTLSARHFKNPALFTVADTTLSPACFSTGTLSPVMAASSTLELPSRTVPSTGTRLPGFTRKISPLWSSSVGTSISVPSSAKRMAVFGDRSISLVMASLVLPLERLSRYFPTVIRVRIMPADSKYRSWEYCSTTAMSPWPRPKLMRYMAKTP